jgi:hypothetical protein
MRQTVVARWLVPSILASAALIVYLLTLSDVHTFDALSYIRDVDGRTGFFFHPHHLLYSPTGWMFWQGWRLAGYDGNSELALKVLNALVGAGCGWGFYRLVLHLTASIPAAIGSAGIFLFSYASWYFSGEVEVYMLALAWLLLALALLVEMVTGPRRRTAPLLGLALGASALYHQTNGLLVPVVLAGIALAPATWPAKARMALLAGTVSGLVVALGYGLVGFFVNGYRSLGQLRDWMFFFVETGWWGHSTRGRLIDIGAGLGNTISTRGAWPYWIGVIVVLLLGIVPAVRRWPRIVALAAIWLVVYGAFFIWWEAENIEFWIATLLPLWLLAGLSLASIPDRRLRRTAEVVAVLGVVLLARHNYPIVERRGDAAYDLQRILSSGVRDQTTPDDLILSSGGVMELYLPYYEGRPNVRTLNGLLFETNGDLDAAFGRISSYISSSLNAGLAVVISREILELPPEIFRRYDVPQERLDDFWQPYRAAMVPIVTHEGTTYFWRIPSAQELALGEGWRWNGFALGWEGLNIAAQEFEDGWCFNPAVDPILNAPLLALDAATVRTVEVTMATSAQGQVAQLFWAGPDGMMSDEHSVRWELNGDGQQHTYRVPLNGAAGWSGIIARLRLDPIAVGDGTAATRTCVEHIRLAQ